jgi:mono/diheme cytochrome c family protein
MMQKRLRTLTMATLLALLLSALLFWRVAALNQQDESAITTTSADPAPTALQVQRGTYLARAGNCLACHTQAGGAAYAGGEGIRTPFGMVYGGNLTPDKQTGLGNWQAADFWRALHNGRSRDGRLLYPAFPYPQFTQITREDADAIFSFLKTLPAVEQRNKEHALRFPYNTQAALAVWRALYFTPLRHQANPEQSAAWNRGRYLVEGPGHCAACHSPRNALGAIAGGAAFSGGMMPAQKWWAPSLLSAQQASVADWSDDDIVALLKSGQSEHGITTGPMAAVVFGSTRYLSEKDLHAMATYLKALPQVSLERATFRPAGEGVIRRGAGIYEKHCASCHGEQGQGVAGIYASLQGNRSVTMPQTANLIQMLEKGGFAPVTEHNPRPYGMPPFSHLLSHRELAELLTFIRQSWGNKASEITELDIMQARVP